MPTFYGYKKCSTCRKAEQALAKSGVDYAFEDITTSPPSQAELKHVLALTGLPVRKLFNVSGEQYKLLGIKDKLPGMSEDAALALLAGNGRLVKRPIVIGGKKATVGFDAETFGKAWKK